MICFTHIDGLLPNDRAVGSAVAVAWLVSRNFLSTLHKITQKICFLSHLTTREGRKHLDVMGIEPVPAASKRAIR